MLKRFSLFIATALLSCAAFGQSAPGFTYGQVPTPGQWNSYFSGKMDFATPLAAGNVLTSSGSGWYSAPPATHGTVTGASVVSANGFSGTVATPSTTPAITLGTTVTGILYGNGASASAAIASEFPTLNQSTTGNAATVTTNANLTGPVTSVGNVTSVASQTGTGSTFVMSASPTLTSPALGTPTSVVLTNGTGLPYSGLTGVVPTWNQSTTGNAATATTATTATTAGNVTGVVAFANGGTASTTAAAAFNALSPMTTTGDIPYESATGTASRLPIGSSAQVLTVVSGKPAWATAGLVIPGYINGFTLSNDGTTPNSVLDIAAGTAADSTNAVTITGTAFKKSTAGTWAGGSGANGMGAGLTIAASTWYHVFAIVNSGSSDVYFDTSPTAANKPSGTTAFRYIGSFITNGSSQIVAFTQTGQIFQWTAPTGDLSGGSATTLTSVTLTTPLGLVTYPLLLLRYNSSQAGAQLTIANSTSGITGAIVVAQGASVNVYANYQAITNTGSQIQYTTSGSSPSVGITTNGYINPHVAPNF